MTITAAMLAGCSSRNVEADAQASTEPTSNSVAVSDTTKAQRAQQLLKVQLLKQQPKRKLLRLQRRLHLKQLLQLRQRQSKQQSLLLQCRPRKQSQR